MTSRARKSTAATRVEKVRIFPTPEQASRLEGWAGTPTAEERLEALEQEVKTLKAIVSRMSCLTGIYSP